MIKQITKVGNSQGIIFDKSVMDMARLRTGDEVNLEVHEGGSITLTPLRPQVSDEEFARLVDRTLEDYAETMRKLA